MHNLKKYRYLIIIALLAIVLIAAIIIKAFLYHSKYADIEPVPLIIENSPTEKQESSPQECTIDIKGAVNNPGPYTTSCDKKVIDLIELAGGLTEEADTSLTNLAKNIYDEMVIIIHSKEELVVTDESHNVTETTISDSDIQSLEPTEQLINVNKATLNELMSLPGIGQAKASAIISYREIHGLFKDIADIMNVKGIGPSLYEKIKIHITT